jgi:adenylate kinase
MNLLIMGKPGAGKGTLASKLLDYYRLTHISTGNIYRDEMAKRSPIGLEAEKYIAQGELVPDELTNGIVKDVLATGKFPNGFMLDGYPRTTAQAVALDRMLQDRNDGLTAVINIDVSDQVLLERMAGRRVCPSCNALYHVSFHPPKTPGICDVCGGSVIQRNDDKEESVLNRLRIYNEKTKPLLDYYRKKHLLIVFDGNRGSDLVFQEIVSRLDAIQHGHH